MVLAVEQAHLTPRERQRWVRSSMRCNWRARRRPPRKGCRTRKPVVAAGDVRVRLFDGKYHDVDSDSRFLRDRRFQGFPGRFKLAQTVSTRAHYEDPGDLPGRLHGRRHRRSQSAPRSGRGMESNGKDQVIRAHVPMSETLKYSSDLRSMTGGRGSFTLEFSHYDELPSNLMDKVVADAKMAAEEDE